MMDNISYNNGVRDGIQSVIVYLKNEIATQDKRSAGDPKLKAHLNAVERCVLETVIFALKEGITIGTPGEDTPAGTDDDTA